MTVGAAALILGSTAGVAITTAAPAQADASCTANGVCVYTQPFGGDVEGSACYNYTYTVPADITVLHVTAIGEGGHSGETAGSSAFHGGGGGKGEKIDTYLTVTPDEQLDVNVADNGSGGVGGVAVSNDGGRGGDSSYISTQVKPDNYSQQPCAKGGFLVLAGAGGGGGGGAAFGDGGGGGDAGFTQASDGGAGGHNGPDSGAGGGGATQSAGGHGGNQASGSKNTAQAGAFLQGGCSDSQDFCGIDTSSTEADESGGGGGGGYYGGGAGGDGTAAGAGGGGGGSGWVDPDAVYSPLTGNALYVSEGTTTDKPSVTISPVGVVPSHDEHVTSVGGNQQATVSFTPPSYDGGSPIKYYTVYALNTLDPIDLNKAPHVQVASSPVTFTNLRPGRYNFYVSATNATGTAPTTGGASATAVYRPPLQALIDAVTVGDGQVTVTASPAKLDANVKTLLYNPITSYTVVVRQGANVTSGPAVATATGTVTPVPDQNNYITTYDSPPITVKGLANGTNYTVTVYASNPVGDGPESNAKNIHPQTVPSAPTNVTATNSTPAGAGANSGVVDVAFTPPASNGGRPITSYTAVSSPGGIKGTAGRGATDVQVTGLTIGTSYTFTVYATSDAGDGPASDPSNEVTPAPKPSPPLNPGAATLDQAAYVSCLPPASDGGSPIVSYEVTSKPGGITADGASCPILVTGLTDGTKYSFTVTATNAAGGTSEPSQASAKITPHAPSGKAPKNDNFASAQVISGASGSVTGTNVGATKEPGEQNIQDTAGGASVWYKWTAPATGSYRFDTCSANPGVYGEIGFFAGNSVSNATEFPPGPGLDLCPSGQAGATLITGTISGGLTLYIKFDGFNENGSNANPPYEGPFTLEWSQQS